MFQSILLRLRLSAALKDVTATSKQGMISSLYPTVIKQTASRPRSFKVLGVNPRRDLSVYFACCVGTCWIPVWFSPAD